jgi:hypothetical protein
MKVKPADRTSAIQEYYFAKKLAELAKMIASGIDIINLRRTLLKNLRNRLKNQMPMVISHTKEFQLLEMHFLNGIKGNFQYHSILKMRYYHLLVPRRV